MYRPTDHEFSILGFQNLGNQTFWLQIVEEDCMIMFRDGEYLLYGYEKSSISVFPESLDDLKTLIKILTPHD